MSDSRKKFHEFALKSILFKGRSDWYFCYLKAERIAHVLALLSENSDGLSDLSHSASELPGTIVHFVAGEVDAPVVLADIMTLLTQVRLAATEGVIAKETVLIVANEYEVLAERFAASLHVSPFATVDDFALPELPLELGASGLTERLSGFSRTTPIKDIKDTKGHIGRGKANGPITQTDRATQILDFVRKNNGVSIKDVAGIVQDCSEKTIQRELALLIERGLIKKVGERRWSQYWGV